MGRGRSAVSTSLRRKRRSIPIWIYLRLRFRLVWLTSLPGTARRIWPVMGRIALQPPSDAMRRKTALVRRLASSDRDAGARGRDDEQAGWSIRGRDLSDGMPFA